MAKFDSAAFVKGLFGEGDSAKESVSAADLTAAFRGMNLADLSDGSYVGKDKFDAEVTKRQTAEQAAEKAKQEAADAKAAAEGTPDAQKQIEALKTALEDVNTRLDASDKEKTRLQREKVVSEKVKDAKLAKLALIEAEALVTDDKDFAAALAEVLEADPDYTKEPGPVTKVKTGDHSTGEPEGQAAANLAAFAEAAGVDPKALDNGEGD